jgi:hypothetical protein
MLVLNGLKKTNTDEAKDSMIRSTWLFFNRTLKSVSTQGHDFKSLK